MIIVTRRHFPRADKRTRIRFLKFFTVNKRNPHTRAAFMPAAGNFIRWCEEHAIADLTQIEPVHAAAYLEQLGKTVSKPTVKQHLATIGCFLTGL